MTAIDIEKALVIRKLLPARGVIGGYIFGRMMYYNTFSHVVGADIIQAAAGIIG